MQHNDITQKGTSRHLYTCCCGREIRICGNAGFDGKQNICTGFLESGHSEFRERSEIINIKILNGCVTMYTCVCVCVFLCVFCDSAALNCSDGHAMFLRKGGLCCA